MSILTFFIIALLIAYSPITQKGKHHWQNIVADVKGKKRKATIYNCNTNEVVDVFIDSQMRFESLKNGTGVRIWLGEKKQKISSNMCWVIKDID